MKVRKGINSDYSFKEYSSKGKKKGRTIALKVSKLRKRNFRIEETERLRK